MVPGFCSSFYLQTEQKGLGASQLPGTLSGVLGNQEKQSGIVLRKKFLFYQKIIDAVLLW